MLNVNFFLSYCICVHKLHIFGFVDCLGCEFGNRKEKAEIEENCIRNVNSSFKWLESNGFLIEDNTITRRKHLNLYVSVGRIQNGILALF